MTVRVLVLALFVTIYVTNACEYGRIGGMFKHGFTSDPATDNFVGDDGGEGSDNYGDIVSIDMDQTMNMYDTGTTLQRVHISDTGKVIFTALGETPTDFEYTEPGQDALFFVDGEAFMYPLWFQDKSTDGVEYMFKYKHILSTDLTDSDGMAVGPTKCILQDIANMIADCSEVSSEHQRETVVTIHEAIIITWKISKGSDIYYFQGIIATDTEDTRGSYVIFIYGDTAAIPADAGNYVAGIVNGLWTGSAVRYGAVCPFSDTTAATIHEKSNCHCGSGNAGTYVFRTADNFATADAHLVNFCTYSTSDFNGICNTALEDDNWANFKMACRPPRIPQDTCLEGITCVATADGGATVTLYIYDSPFAQTSFTFLNTIDYATDSTITIMSDGGCAQEFIISTDNNNLAYYTYQVETLSSTGDVCGVIYTAGDPDTLNMLVHVFDDAEPEYAKPGTRLLSLECSIVPIEIQAAVTKGPILSTSIEPLTGRKAVMFPSTTKMYDNDNPDTRIPANTEVELGQDIFITVCFDWGDRLVIDLVEAYGIYVYYLAVSNNPLFAAQSGNDANRLMVLIQESDGCETNSDPNSGFYIDSAFSSSLTGTSVTDGILSDDDTDTYNFCQSTGKLDAIMWLIAGGSNTLYFKGKLGFGRNQAYISESRCSDSCEFQNVDYAERKRRDADGIDENPYPDVEIETSITMSRPKDQSRTEEQVECVDSTVAISTVVALMILMLMAMSVTIMLFIKLQTRQRKRV